MEVAMTCCPRPLPVLALACLIGLAAVPVMAELNLPSLKVLRLPATHALLEEGDSYGLRR
jgi:hypothetical protein